MFFKQNYRIFWKWDYCWFLNLNYVQLQQLDKITTSISSLLYRDLEMLYVLLHFGLVVFYSQKSNVSI